MKIFSRLISAFKLGSPSTSSVSGPTPGVGVTDKERTIQERNRTGYALIDTDVIAIGNSLRKKDEKHIDTNVVLTTPASLDDQTLSSTLNDALNTKNFSKILCPLKMPGFFHWQLLVIRKDQQVLSCGLYDTTGKMVAINAQILNEIKKIIPSITEVPLNNSTWHTWNKPAQKGVNCGMVVALMAHQLRLQNTHELAKLQDYYAGFDPKKSDQELRNDVSKIIMEYGDNTEKNTFCDFAPSTQAKLEEISYDENDPTQKGIFDACMDLTADEFNSIITKLNDTKALLPDDYMQSLREQLSKDKYANFLFEEQDGQRKWKEHAEDILIYYSLLQQSYKENAVTVRPDINTGSDGNLGSLSAVGLSGITKTDQTEESVMQEYKALLRLKVELDPSNIQGIIDRASKIVNGAKNFSFESAELTEAIASSTAIFDTAIYAQIAITAANKASDSTGAEEAMNALEQALEASKSAAEIVKALPGEPDEEDGVEETKGEEQPAQTLLRELNQAAQAAAERATAEALAAADRAEAEAERAEAEEADTGVVESDDINAATQAKAAAQDIIRITEELLNLKGDELTTAEEALREAIDAEEEALQEAIGKVKKHSDTISSDSEQLDRDMDILAKYKSQLPDQETFTIDKSAVTKHKKNKDNMNPDIDVMDGYIHEILHPNQDPKFSLEITLNALKVMATKYKDSAEEVAQSKKAADEQFKKFKTLLKAKLNEIDYGDINNLASCKWIPVDTDGNINLSELFQNKDTMEVLSASNIQSLINTAIEQKKKGGFLFGQPKEDNYLNTLLELAKLDQFSNVKQALLDTNTLKKLIPKKNAELKTLLLEHMLNIPADILDRCINTRLKLITSTDLINAALENKNFAVFERITKPLDFAIDDQTLMRLQQAINDTHPIQDALQDANTQTIDQDLEQGIRNIFKSRSKLVISDIKRLDQTAFTGFIDAIQKIDREDDTLLSALSKNKMIMGVISEHAKKSIQNAIDQQSTSSTKNVTLSEVGGEEKDPEEGNQDQTIENKVTMQTLSSPQWQTTLDTINVSDEVAAGEQITTTTRSNFQSELEAAANETDKKQIAEDLITKMARKVQNKTELKRLCAQLNMNEKTTFYDIGLTNAQHSNQTSIATLIEQQVLDRPGGNIKDFYSFKTKDIKERIEGLLKDPFGSTKSVFFDKTWNKYSQYKPQRPYSLSSHIQALVDAQKAISKYPKWMNTTALFHGDENRLQIETAEIRITFDRKNKSITYSGYDTTQPIKISADDAIMLDSLLTTYIGSEEQPHPASSQLSTFQTQGDSIEEISKQYCECYNNLVPDPAADITPTGLLKIAKSYQNGRYVHQVKQHPLLNKEVTKLSGDALTQLSCKSPQSGENENIDAYNDCSEEEIRGNTKEIHSTQQEMIILGKRILMGMAHLDIDDISGRYTQQYADTRKNNLQKCQDYKDLYDTLSRSEIKYSDFEAQARDQKADKQLTGCALYFKHFLSEIDVNQDVKKNIRHAKTLAEITNQAELFKLFSNLENNTELVNDQAVKDCLSTLSNTIMTGDNTLLDQVVSKTSAVVEAAAAAKAEAAAEAQATAAAKAEAEAQAAAENTKMIAEGFVKNVVIKAKTQAGEERQRNLRAGAVEKRRAEAKDAAQAAAAKDAAQAAAEEAPNAAGGGEPGSEQGRGGGKDARKVEAATAEAEAAAATAEAEASEAAQRATTEVEADPAQTDANAAKNPDRFREAANPFENDAPYPIGATGIDKTTFPNEALEEANARAPNAAEAEDRLKVENEKIIAQINSNYEVYNVGKDKFRNKLPEQQNNSVHKKKRRFEQSFHALICEISEVSPEDPDKLKNDRQLESNTLKSVLYELKKILSTEDMNRCLKKIRNMYSEELGINPTSEATANTAAETAGGGEGNAATEANATEVKTEPKATEGGGTAAIERAEVEAENKGGSGTIAKGNNHIPVKRPFIIATVVLFLINLLSNPTNRSGPLSQVTPKRTLPNAIPSNQSQAANDVDENTAANQAEVVPNTTPIRAIPSNQSQEAAVEEVETQPNATEVEAAEKAQTEDAAEAADGANATGVETEPNATRGGGIAAAKDAATGVVAIVDNRVQSSNFRVSIGDTKAQVVAADGGGNKDKAAPTQEGGPIQWLKNRFFTKFITPIKRVITPIRQFLIGAIAQRVRDNPRITGGNHATQSDTLLNEANKQAKKTTKKKESAQLKRRPTNLDDEGPKQEP